MSSSSADDDIGGGGERVTHLFPNDCYFAHLSIYYFASRFCQDGQVLDAGSGGGYGSNYLADHGASFVNAVELSEASVVFSQHHFRKPNLRYQAMNVENVTGFQRRAFDLIYSSNVLEHVPDALKFVRRAWELLKPGGTMLVAVPPIVRKVDWDENIANIYHLNIWTPRQWHQVLGQYFGEIECYWHGLRAGLPLDFHNTPEQTVINEKDFVFKPVTVDHFYVEPSLTVIFLVRKPRPKGALPRDGQPVAFIENSFTRPLPAQPSSVPPGLEQARPAPAPSTFPHLLHRIKTIANERGLLAVFPAAIRHIKWRISRRAL